MKSAFILSIFSFLLFLVMHIYVFHEHRIKRRFRTLIIVALISILIYSIVYWFAVFCCQQPSLSGQVEGISSLLRALFCYAFFAYFYFTHVVLVIRSITTRFMVDISRSKNKCLDIQQIKNSFSMHNKLKTEIEDMVELKRITQEEDYYTNTSKGSMQAKVFMMIRDYLNLN